MNQYHQKSKSSCKIIIICVVIILLLLSAIYLGVTFIAYQSAGVGRAFGGAGFYKTTPATNYAIFHIEPQVVYRLDDHRYVEIENYESCNTTLEDDGNAIAYYYDTQLGIKTPVSPKIRNFKGRLINADPTGKNIAFAGGPDEFFHSDKGNGPLWTMYSTDYGGTFSFYYFGNRYSYIPIKESEDYTVVITDKDLLMYGKRYASGSFVDIVDLTTKDEQGKYIRRSESDLFVPDYPGLMDHYECDSTIKGEIELIPVDEYKQKHGDNNEQ